MTDVETRTAGQLGRVDLGTRIALIDGGGVLRLGYLTRVEHGGIRTAVSLSLASTADSTGPIAHVYVPPETPLEPIVEYADEACPDCLGTGRRRIGYDVATVQRTACVDLGTALGQPTAAVELGLDTNGYANTWADLCAIARRLAHG